MIRFGCPRCKAVMKAADRTAGTKVACLACGQRLMVPCPLPPTPPGSTPTPHADTASPLDAPRPELPPPAGRRPTPLLRRIAWALAGWPALQVWKILAAVFGQVARLAGYGWCLFRRHRARVVVLREHAALGERLVQAGSGDAALRAQVAELDDRIRSVATAGGRVGPLVGERQGVLVRMAASALTKPPPAYADSEHRAAVAAAEALDAREKERAAAFAKLFPPDVAGRLRLCAGVACLVVLLAIVLTTGPAGGGRGVFGPPGGIASVDQDREVAEAVGLVVCGLAVNRAGGEALELPLGLGSCAAVSPSGHLLTNKHVVERVWAAERPGSPWRGPYWGDVTARPETWVFFGKARHVAKILHVSDRHDLAILKVERAGGPFFRLAASEDLRRGGKVFACGFPADAATPLSEEEEDALRRKVIGVLTGETRRRRIEEWFQPRDFEYVRTDGTVSRVVVEERGRAWVQHSAPVNPGNSGGPLVSEGGIVVGINTRRPLSSQGIFFALALPQLREEIDTHVRGAVWE